MPWEAPVTMAVRGCMMRAPFCCLGLSSVDKIISMQDNLGSRQSGRKSAAPGRPTTRVGQLLFVVQQAAQALAAERLAPLGLSPRAWGVLSTLAESGPLTQIELATTMSIDRTAMVYLIDELEEGALVERTRHPRDRRAFAGHLASSNSLTSSCGARIRQASVTSSARRPASTSASRSITSGQPS